LKLIAHITCAATSASRGQGRRCSLDPQFAGRRGGGSPGASRREGFSVFCQPSRARRSGLLEVEGPRTPLPGYCSARAGKTGWPVSGHASGGRALHFRTGGGTAGSRPVSACGVLGSVQGSPAPGAGWRASLAAAGRGRMDPRLAGHPGGHLHFRTGRRMHLACIRKSRGNCVAVAIPLR
jgi:hypothetical protein